MKNFIIQVPINTKKLINLLPIGKQIYLSITKFTFLLFIFSSFILSGCKKIVDETGKIGTCPTIKSTDPISGAINVATNKVITITFNDDLNPATVHESTIQLKAGTTRIQGVVTYANKVATFTPSVPLSAKTVYTGVVTIGVRDFARTALPVEYTWNFNTGNTPSVVFTDPFNGQTDVSFNQVIQAAFSTNMDPSSITATTYIIKDGEKIIPGAISFVGLNAIFTPTNSLTPNTLFTGTISSSVKDKLGNVMGSDYKWSFATGSVPSVILTDPIDSSTNVVLNKVIKVVFNKTMDVTTLTTTNFNLKKGSVIVPGVISYAGKTATFVPTTVLDINTVYTGTVSINVKDTADNNLLADYVWSFRTGNAPVVISTDPANGATDVPLAKIITANFSTAMNPATITGTTFIVTRGTIAVPGVVSYAGTTASFAPSSPLLVNTIYTATITTDVKGTLGNSLSVNHVWTFSTVGLPPSVISTDPTNASTNVVLNKLVSAVFNKTMNPVTINSANFTLKQGFLNVPGIVSYSGKTATYSPASILAPNTVYTASISSNVKDSSGLSMVADFTWNFTTGNAPVVISTDPAPNATGVVTNKAVTATFSTPMNPTTITGSSFTVKRGTTSVIGVVTYTGSTATFTPSVNYATDAVYTCTVTTAAKDVSGNSMVNNYVWSFTTASTPVIPGISPTVISTDPSNNAINVAVNKIITANFSTAMTASTINGTSVTIRQGATQITGIVTYAGTTATFTPSAALLTNTIYTGTITNAVKDLAGNAMLVNHVWTFTTTGSLPTVTSTDPTNNATNVVITKTATANFSKVMDPTTINAATVTIFQGATQIFGAVSYLGTTMTFNPVMDLTNNRLYTATITTGAKDATGNALAANYVWNFTTELSPPPPPIMGRAASFGAFGGNAGITNQGLNTIINNGGIGTTAASTLVTGFHDGLTADVYTQTPLNVGRATQGIFTAPPAPGTATSFTIASNAALDALVAYNSISPASKPGGIDPGAGELGGLTLAPGIYRSASGTFNITNGNLTLDAQGNPNAQWFFQTAAGLTVGIAGPAGARSVLMINGGLPKNVYWYVGSAATINGAGGGVMSGTIISSAGISFSTSGNAVQTVLNGRAISLNASVTMVNTTINVQ